VKETPLTNTIQLLIQILSVNFTTFNKGFVKLSDQNRTYPIFYLSCAWPAP